MAEIFGELSGFGISNANSMNIFQKEEKPDAETKVTKSKPIEQIIFDGKITCPVCEREFKTKSIKSGRLKLVRTDSDLRPIYDLFDPALYDVIVCNSCGYAALKKIFHDILPIRKNLIKEKISRQFVGRDYPEIYTYDIAIERYKLALYDSIVIESKDSEKAYMCLKIAWLYRGYYESLDNTSENEDKIAQLKAEETTFITHAVDGFNKTYQREKFPAMDLSELTVVYLLGELSRRIGRLEEASKWISMVIISKEASSRLKDRARVCKNLILSQKSAE